MQQHSSGMAAETSWKKPSVQTKRNHRGIRDTIHLLLSVLSECGAPKIASESIRGAKFNQEEATLDLWRLTFHVMQAATFLDGGFSMNSVDAITYHTVTPLNLPTVQITLQQYMLEMGYMREAFYGPAVGSRELLLAFSWLLHRTKMFSKLGKHYVMVARREEIPLRPSTTYLIEHVLEENRVMRCDLEDVITTLRMNADDPSGPLCTDALQKLVWLRGEVGYKWKMVEKLCRAHQTLADKIHRSTHTNSPISRKNENSKGHLSMHEVFLLRYPSQMKVCLARLQKCVSVLQKVIQWQECEPLFWQWMESVLDLQDEEVRAAEVDEDEEGGDGQCEVKSDEAELLSRVNLLQEEFEALLKKNKPHIDRLKGVWDYKTKTVLHKDFNAKLHVFREQLKYEYPLVSTELTNQADVASATVQVLDVMDNPIYAPAVQQTCADRHPRPFAAPVQAAESATNQLTQALHNQLETVTRQLGDLDRAMEEKRLEMKNCLESMETKMPASLCKIELGHLVHHHMHNKRSFDT